MDYYMGLVQQFHWVPLKTTGNTTGKIETVFTGKNWVPKHLQTQSKVFQKYKLNPYSLNPITFSTGTSPHSVEAAQNVPFDSNAAPCAKPSWIYISGCLFPALFQAKLHIAKRLQCRTKFYEPKDQGRLKIRNHSWKISKCDTRRVKSALRTASNWQGSNLWDSFIGSPRITA